ncbi:unnamed protein product [Oikopleura dioica]|uniref:Uncharacterized protein n=1 Tax=Oikopleura dioica TaxID=34765 RepID=E4XQZ6_OIKDI|nr:unnamed protein product [Oikopleura dioica]
MAPVGDTILNCRANANSINDDHADKSTNFIACHKQSRSLRALDCWNVHSWTYRRRLDLYSPTQALEEKSTKEKHPSFPNGPISWLLPSSSI